MITITTTFLGLDVIALVYRDHIVGWVVDELKVISPIGIDLVSELKESTLARIDWHVRDEARNHDYKWM